MVKNLQMYSMAYAKKGRADNSFKLSALDDIEWFIPA